jgi:hypothetical protein
MSSLPTETPVVRAETVTITGDTITVELSDGRSISEPLAWYPRLLHGTLEERTNWRLIGGGSDIHWPALNEDISVGTLLADQASGESQQSLKRWLEERVYQRSEQASRVMLKHKGYTGHVAFDDEAGLFHGEVIDLRDVITFQGTSVEELKSAFQDSVDDYLQSSARSEAKRLTGHSRDA